jgi:16S rRNA (cytosine1402-N4)-methyltransferase
VESGASAKEYGRGNGEPSATSSLLRPFSHEQEKGREYPPGIPLTEVQMAGGKTLKSKGKAIKPTAQEVEENKRSRSSVLRVAIKIGEPDSETQR